MSKAKKIVLAEDNLADAELLRISFENLSIEHELVHFINGRKLLDYLQDTDLSNILLAMLDLNMPVMNGVETLTQLKNDPSLKRLPDIMFSSSKFQTDVNSCYELGANAYVAKPMDLDELDEIVQSITCFWADKNVRTTGAI